MNHIDQEAELYALGMLEDDERARVDEHIATCDACLQRIGAAEAAVTALVDVSQQRPQRTIARWPLAVAAAFALATAGVLGQNFLLRGELAGDGALLATMVNSHFDHAQFQTAQGAQIPAKAIYERHGKWYEILADGEPAWHVVFVRPDGTRDPALTNFARRGASSVLIATPATPVGTIELDDDAGRVIGSMRPALQAETE